MLSTLCCPCHGNQCVKFEEKSFNSVDVMVTSMISKSIKGEQLFKLHLKLAALIQNVALRWKTNE